MLKSVMRKKQTTKTVLNRCQIIIDLDEAYGKTLTHEQSAKTNCVCMATVTNAALSVCNPFLRQAVIRIVAALCDVTAKHTEALL